MNSNTQTRDTFHVYHLPPSHLLCNENKVLIAVIETCEVQFLVKQYLPGTLALEIHPYRSILKECICAAWTEI